MKTVRLFNVYFIFLVALLFVACSKEEGPTGPAGPQGPQGEQGIIGPAGEDGSMIYAGSIKPSTNVGNIGDLYLNEKTGELYGPKTDKGWGTPGIVLLGAEGKNGKNGINGKDGTDGIDGKEGVDGKDGTDGIDGKKGVDGKDGTDGIDGKKGVDGKDGVDGEDGSTTRSGNGAPAQSLGNPGDYYLDRTNYRLYGPKAGIVIIGGSPWGTPINLKGPKGDKGDKGDPGNANVTQYNFGAFTLSPILPGVISKDFEIPVGKSIIDKSLVYVYVRKASTWLSMPGHISSQGYHYEILINAYPTTTNVWLSRDDGTATDSFDGLRIIVVEASNSINISRKNLPDFNNYRAVSNYYGIQNNK